MMVHWACTGRVVALVASAMALLATGCGVDGGPETSPTAVEVAQSRVASASPADGHTPERRGCPASVGPAGCDFASRLVAIIESGDAGQLTELYRPTQVTCPAENASPVIGGPQESVCGSDDAGTVQLGVAANNESEGWYFSPTYAASPIGLADARAADDFGEGSVSVAGVGCPLENSGFNCSSEIVVAFSGIRRPGVRFVYGYVATIDPDTAEWGIVRVVISSSPVGIPEILRGGDTPGHTPGTLKNLRFFPWS